MATNHRLVVNIERCKEAEARRDAKWAELDINGAKAVDVGEAALSSFVPGAWVRIEFLDGTVIDRQIASHEKLGEHECFIRFAT